MLAKSGRIAFDSRCRRRTIQGKDLITSPGKRLAEVHMVSNDNVWNERYVFSILFLTGCDIHSVVT